MGTRLLVFSPHSNLAAFRNIDKHKDGSTISIAQATFTDT